MAPTWAFVGVALLLWAALALGLSPHWRQQAGAATQAAEVAQADSATAAAAAAARAAALSRQQPQSGRAALPAAAQRDERTASLLQLAVALGLSLDSVAQRVLPAEGGVQRVELNLSARAGYSAARRFVEEALAGDPGLALQQVDLARQVDATPTLQVQLHFVLLQRVEQTQ